MKICNNNYIWWTESIFFLEVGSSTLSIIQWCGSGVVVSGSSPNYPDTSPNYQINFKTSFKSKITLCWLNSAFPFIVYFWICIRNPDPWTQINPDPHHCYNRMDRVVGFPSKKFQPAWQCNYRRDKHLLFKVHTCSIYTFSARSMSAGLMNFYTAEEVDAGVPRQSLILINDAPGPIHSQYVGS